MARRRFVAKGMSTAAALVTASILVAACGAGTATPGVANIGTTTTTTTPASTKSGNSASRYSNGLAYSRCMRSHGVTNFPDPSANGSIQLGGGTNPSSPVFQSAQSKCQKLLPGAGFPSPGTTTNPSAAALAQMLNIAQCMRRHGIIQFPDPTTKIPSRSGLPSGGGVISDRNGVILVFPGTLNMQSATFIRAAAACKFALTNH